MSRIVVTLAVLVFAAGCRSTGRTTTIPTPHQADEHAYLEGFVDGCRGVRSASSRPRDKKRSRSAYSYGQGVRDGYVTGRRDEMQQE